MAKGVTVSDTDYGYKILVGRLYGLSKSKPVVRVGILADDAERVYVRKSERPSNDTGTEQAVTVLQVAIWNEFGTSRTPSRSFLREWFDTNREVAKGKFLTLMKSVIRGERTKEQILDLIGLWAVGEIQKNISKGVPPPNAQSTIDAKGSSTPLIDTGVLRSSISYMVEQ